MEGGVDIGTRGASTACHERLATNLSALPPATREAVLRDDGPPTRWDGVAPATVSTDDGQWLPVHASADPRRAAEAMLDRLSAGGAAPSVVISIGVGLGYVLEALEARAIATKVIAIEPVPSIARAMLSRREWTSWLASGRLTLLVGPGYDGATDAWRAIDSSAPADPPTIVSPLVDRAFPHLVAPAMAVARRIVGGARANAEARRQFAGRYLTQTLTNLPVIATEGDAGALSGALDGLPAVVVGAGPSLDRRLELLREVAGRAVVIAVDTAVRPLMAAGIRPHVVVGVDPSETNARHLRDLGDLRGLWLVAEPSLHPSVFPPFADRTFTFAVGTHDPWPWLAAHGLARGQLRAWGSVLTTAFDLACVAGCGPIVFVGADLAYSRGLQYCRNTTYEPLWRDCADDTARACRFAEYLARHPHTSALDVHGHDVATAPHFLQFRDWIVSRADEWTAAAGRARRVMNASGEGILHGGPIEVADDASVHAMLDVGGTSVTAREVWTRLARAHRTSSATRAETLGRLAAALVDRSACPLDRWVAFASGTHGRGEVEAALAGAAETVVARTSVEAWLSAALARWERIGSIDEAERAIHPDYAFASAQAAAQVAHALDDLRQRSVLAPGATVTPGSPVAPTRRLRVLDVGCGLGRTMRPFVDRGLEVDGVDSSGRMIALASDAPDLAGCRFFRSSGADCGDAPDGRYDLVTMFHAFHRVRPRAVRQALLRAMARALAPGGVVHLQLPFFPGRTPASVPRPHVPWAHDELTTEASDLSGEVWVTPSDLPDVYADVAAMFRDVRFQVVDFPPATPRFDDGAERLAHLLVSAAVGWTLATRVYGVPADPASSPQALSGTSAPV